MVVMAEPPVINNYLALLEQIHRHLLPRTYVEIGVHEGRSFSKVEAGTIAVGIDPILAKQRPVNRSAKVFALTSDDFFVEHDLRSILNGYPVDLAFIDGMHLFEFALRDFMHLERFCSEESVILLHDCYPVNARAAGRKPVRGWWNGDVWKLIICLKEHRPDVQISVVDVPAGGLGILTNLDPASSLLAEHYEEICQRFRHLEYAVLDDRKEKKLNLVPSDWAGLEPLLPRQPYRRATAHPSA